MKCQTCVRPNSPCLGERVVHLCDRPEYAEYLATYDPTDPRHLGRTSAIDPSVRDAVNECRYRGSILPATELSIGCCGGSPELTECAMGKGDTPGFVTLGDCLVCKSSELFG